MEKGKKPRKKSKIYETFGRWKKKNDLINEEKGKHREGSSWDEGNMRFFV